MTITSAQQTQLERPAPKVAYFMELQFVTATQRLSTWNRNLTWGGFTWLGLGGLVSISKINESERTTSGPLSFNLNAADPGWIALAMGPDTEYRGRIAQVYMCPLNSSNDLVDTPELCWRGRMDSLVMGVSGDEGLISLRCETAAYAFKRRPTLRINAEQQRIAYPGDTGLDYLNDLIAKPQLWLSKKFLSQ